MKYCAVLFDDCVLGVPTAAPNIERDPACTLLDIPRDDRPIFYFRIHFLHSVRDNE